MSFLLPRMMYWEKGKVYIRIERCILGIGEQFLDGTHILYVNGRNQDETPIGRLMHDFSCTNASEMYYELLAEQVRFFKERKEGILIMCKAMEDMRNQALQEGLEAGRKEGRKEIALRMLEMGKYTFDEISTLSELSVEEVKRLQTENNQ